MNAAPVSDNSTLLLDEFYRELDKNNMKLRKPDKIISELKEQNIKINSKNKVNFSEKDLYPKFSNYEAISSLIINLIEFENKITDTYCKIKKKISNKRDNKLINPVLITFHKKLKHFINSIQIFKSYQKNHPSIYQEVFIKSLDNRINECERTIHLAENLLNYFGVNFKPHTPLVYKNSQKSKKPSLSRTIPISVKITLYPPLSCKGINAINKIFNNQNRIKREIEKINQTRKNSFYNKLNFKSLNARLHLYMKGEVAIESSKKGIFAITKHLIGSGAFKKIYLAVDLKSHELVAHAVTKLIQKIDFPEPCEIEKLSFNEFKILGYFQNDPEFVKVLHICSWISQKENRKIGIMMEYCNKGSLKTYIHKITSNKQKSPNYWNILLDCFIALVKLEERGIIHRDIKPENILLNKENTGRLRAKIGDFGFALTRAQLKNNHSNRGTMLYTPPECLSTSFNYNSQTATSLKGDIWAMGCVLYEMRFKTEFFDYPLGSSTEEQVEFFDYLISLKQEDIWNKFTSDQDKDGLKQLNVRMLSIDPEDRPSAIECFEIFESVRQLTLTPSTTTH